MKGMIGSSGTESVSPYYGFRFMVIRSGTSWEPNGPTDSADEAAPGCLCIVDRCRLMQIC